MKKYKECFHTLQPTVLKMADWLCWLFRADLETRLSSRFCAQYSAWQREAPQQTLDGGMHLCTGKLQSERKWTPMSQSQRSAVA